MDVSFSLQEVVVLTVVLGLLTCALCRELFRFAKPHRPIDFPFADYHTRRARQRRRRVANARAPAGRSPGPRHRASLDYPFMHMKRIGPFMHMKRIGSGKRLRR